MLGNKFDAIMRSIGKAETTYTEMLKSIESKTTKHLSLMEAFTEGNIPDYNDFFNNNEYSDAYNRLFAEYSNSLSTKLSDLKPATPLKDINGSTIPLADAEVINKGFIKMLTAYGEYFATKRGTTFDGSKATISFINTTDGNQDGHTYKFKPDTKLIRMAVDGSANEQTTAYIIQGSNEEVLYKNLAIYMTTHIDKIDELKSKNILDIKADIPKTFLAYGHYE